MGGARVLLLGTGTHAITSGLPNVPAVEATLAELRESLIDRCGFPASAITTVFDPANPTDFGERVEAAVKTAGELLMVYYVGHGLISPQGTLHLATQHSQSGGSTLSLNSLNYSTFIDVLNTSPARNRIIMLDACFSGRAIDAMNGIGEPSDVVHRVQPSYSFVLTSASRFEVALAPSGSRRTAFTGKLLDLLSNGDPDGGADLTLNSVYEGLCRTLIASGLPSPRCRSDNRAGDLILAANPAYRPDREPATHPWVERDASKSVECPYKGLAAFDVLDERYFHGRRRMTRELVTRLAERYADPQPLIIEGASGAGKSSIVRAGLIPAITRGELGLADSTRWPRWVITPTAFPLAALAHLVAPAVGWDPQKVESYIRTDTRCFAKFLDEHLRTLFSDDASRSRAVLVVDQVEEMYTLCQSRADRRLFVAAVAHAARGIPNMPPRALVLLGIRADYLHRLTQMPDLKDTWNGRVLTVGAMDVQELREAITGPADVVGLRLEPTLVDLILDDLRQDPGDDGAYEAGQLPLLSHALRSTWQEQAGATLTVAAYRSAGGVRNALARTADQLLDSLTDADKQTARTILLRLIRLGDVDITRRVVPLQELRSGLPAGSAERVLAVLTGDRGRLIVVDADTVTVTHEALIREWPTLRKWIRIDQEDLLKEQRFTEDAAAWQTSKKNRRRLYRGDELKEALAWAAVRRAQHSMPASIRRFLWASRLHHWWRRLCAAGVLCAAILAVVLAQAYVKDSRNLSQVVAAEDAESSSIRVLDDNPPSGLRLAIAAYRLSPGAKMRGNVIHALLGNQYIASIDDHTNAVTSVAVNGRLVATASDDGTVSIWDTNGKSHPRHLATTVDQHSDLESVALSSNLLAAGADDGTVRLWKVANPAKPIAITSLPARHGAITAVAFSRDGRRLLAAGDDGATQVWDTGADQQPVQLSTLTARVAVTAVAFAPDDRTVAVAASDGHTTLWDLSAAGTGRQVGAMRTSTSDTWAIAFSPDGRTLAATGQDNDIDLWNLADRTHSSRLSVLHGLDSSAYGIAFSPDGRTVAAGGGGNRVVTWDIQNPAHPRLSLVLKGHSGPIYAIVFMSSSVMITGSWDNTAKIWDLSHPMTPRRTAVIEAGTGTYAAAIRPDGRYVATAGDSGVALWNLSDPASPVRNPLVGRQADRTDLVAYSPDGRWLASAGTQGTVSLWDLTDAAHPSKETALVGSTKAVSGLAFTADGKTLAVTGTDGTATLWDVSKPQHPYRQASLDSPDEPHALTDAAFSPDGHLFATGRDTGVTAWTLGVVRRPYSNHDLAFHSDRTTSVTFNSDGTLLADGGADNRVVLWDPSDFTWYDVLTDHSAAVEHVRFGPDGYTLASASDDHTVSLWDTSDPFHPITTARITDHTAPVRDVEFATAGTSMVTADRDGTVLVWDLSRLAGIERDPLRTACSIVGTGLAKDDWNLLISADYRSTCP